MCSRFLVSIIFLPLFVFSQGRNNSVYSEYDAAGKLTVEKIPDSLLLHVAKDNYACLYGLKNSANEWIVKPSYNEIIGPKNGFYEVNKSEKWGILDKTGQEIIPAAYSNITVPCADDDIFTGWENGIINYNYYYGKFIAEKDGSAGILDLNNKIIFPFEYSSIHLFENGILSLEKNGEYGFSTSDGFISPIKYNRPMLFDESGFAIYSSDASNVPDENLRNFGVIDLKEREIIPAVYDQIIFRRQNNSSAKEIFWAIRNGKYGFYDTSGKILLDVSYDVNSFFENDFRFGFFQDSIAIISQNSKYGAVGLDGKFIIPLQYDSLQIFSISSIAFKKNGKFGLLGKNRKLISNSVYSSIESFTDVISSNTENKYVELFLVSKNGKYGLVNSQDSIVLPFIYDDAWRSYERSDRIYLIKNNQLSEFYNLKIASDSLFKSDLGAENGLAIFNHSKNSKNNYSSGVINGDGKILLPPSYAIISENQNAIIFKNQDGESGIIYPNGNSKIFPSDYKNFYYDNGYLWFTVSSGKIGAINSTGTLVIDTNYFAFSEQMQGSKHFWVKIAEIQHDEKENLKVKGNWELIDSTGKIILQPEWDFPASFKDSVMINSRNSKYGIIKEDGKILLEPVYDNILCDVNGYFILEKDEKFGIASPSGKIISPPQWKNFTGFLGDYAIGYNDDKIELVDVTGNIIETANDFSKFNSDISERINFYETKNYWDTYSEIKTQSLPELVPGFDSLEKISNPMGKLAAKNLVTGIQCLNYKDNALLDNWNQGIGLHDIYWWNMSNMNEEENDTNKTTTYKINVDTVTSISFSLSVETTTCYPALAYNNCNTETDHRNFDVRGDTLVKLELKDLFDPAKNYRVKLNAMIGDAVHAMDDIEIDCTNPTNYIDEAGENFSIGENGITFYLPQSNANLEFPDENFLKVYIPYEKLKSIIAKKSVANDLMKKKK